MELTTWLAVWLFVAAGLAGVSSAVLLAWVIREGGCLGVRRPRWSRHDAGGDGSGRAGDGSSARRFSSQEE